MSTYGTPLQIHADLHDIFARFPLECLTHLRDNRHRLVRGVYQTSDGQGCLMFLLSELLPAEKRIDSKDSLKRFFGRPVEGKYLVDQDPYYQPARWIVRIWDGEPHPERYGTADPLPEHTLMAVLNEAIAEQEYVSARVLTSKEQPEPGRRKVRASLRSGRYSAGRPKMYVQI